MSNQFIDIKAFAKLASISINTIRRKIKTLPETDKKTYIQYIPVVGRGGQKIMLDKALVNLWTAMSNQETVQKDNDNSLGNQENDTIQEQIKKPEQSSNDNFIIEILRGQIEYLQKQGEVKDSQISELLERLKESQYNLANTQKQITQPGPVEPHLKWWQFWK